MIVRDDRSAPDVGRRARLELLFTCRNGRTVLERGYAEPPLRVGRELPGGESARMILTTSSPGLFGGDRFEQRIEAGPGARVDLRSQSALQLHPSLERSVATIQSSYAVGEGGVLRCEWDPLIPFTDGRLDQRISIDLAPRARLLWSDALMCGRHARGERWRFASLAHELKVVRGGALQYLERYRIEPGGDRFDRPWMAADAAYFGTTLAADTDGTRTEREGERLRAELRGIPGVEAGVDILAGTLLVVRLMAISGIAFRRARAAIATLSASWDQIADRPMPRPTALNP